MADDDHQPPDLAHLEDWEQSREVYAWAGLALYRAQVLEHALVNFLYASELHGIRSQEESDEFFEKQFQQVMGRLVSAARSKTGAPNGLEDRLAEALRLRNWIAHHFFRERAELFMSEEGRRLMLDELAGAIRTFRDADSELTELMFTVGEPHGLTGDLVEKIFQQMKRQSASD